jgi:hypothetical protein
MEAVLDGVVGSLWMGLRQVDRNLHTGVSDKAFDTLVKRVEAAGEGLPTGQFNRVGPLPVSEPDDRRADARRRSSGPRRRAR